MRAVMIGGGVAGCALAAALRETQGERVILERRVAGDAAGMGFILMPNGLHALQTIAPEHDWFRAGRVLNRVELCRHDGRSISDVEIDASVCISREVFLRMLRSACRGVPVLEGAAFSRLVREASGLTRAVELENGTCIEGDVFFGCDGANSKVRRELFPHARLNRPLVMEIVSVARSTALAARLGNSFRKFHDAEGGFAIGMLAQSDASVIWFVQFDATRWTLPSADARTLSEFVRARIGGWAPEVVEAFLATNFADSHLWPTRDLPPLAQLAQENLALLGDAAHACLPFTSQGANGALVDAVCLREVLQTARDERDVRVALARYSELRRPHHAHMFREGQRLRAAFLAPLHRGELAIPLVA